MVLPLILIHSFWTVVKDTVLKQEHSQQQRQDYIKFLQQSCPIMEIICIAVSVKMEKNLMNLYGPKIHGATETANPVLELEKGDQVSVKGVSSTKINGDHFSYFSAVYISQWNGLKITIQARKWWPFLFINVFSFFFLFVWIILFCKHPVFMSKSKLF